MTQRWRGTEMSHQTAAGRYVGAPIAVALLVSVCAMAVVGGVQKADAATTSASKTYWHKIGNDRFRVYDVGGNDGSAPNGGPGDGFMPGYPPYLPHELPSSWSQYGKEDWQEKVRLNKNASNYAYSQRVDWPVNFIFRNNASISRVKQGLRHQGLDTDGGPMYLSLSDSPGQYWGGPHVFWDRDQGLKEHICSGLPIPGSPRETNHIRLYADSSEQFDGGSQTRPVDSKGGTTDDRLYNPTWGFYVLGTSHIDYLECPPTEATWFGQSERTEARIAYWASREWGAQNVEYSSQWLNNVEGLGHVNHVRVEGNHIWQNNGWATVVKIGKKPVAGSSTSPPDDDPNPGEGGEEGPPPPEPAKDGDVDGDGFADLVTLHTSNTAYTYKGSNGSSQTSFAGNMNSALWDGTGHHVIDVADVNRDEYADLITLGNDGNVNVYPGQSNGSFGAWILARSSITPGTRTSDGHEPIAVADVTGDGYGDLVTFYAPQGNLYVYPGRADGKFGDGITMGGGNVNSSLFDRQGVYFVDVRDVSRDGHADLVAISSSASSSYGAALVYEGWQGGIMQWPTQISPQVDPIMSDGSGNEPLGLGDVNGDGYADLATVNSGGSISVYAGMHTLNEPTQTYQFLNKTPVNSLSGLNSSFMDGAGDDFVGLLDKNGDGKDDLVKVAANGTVSVALGASNLQFGTFTQWTTGVTSARFGVTGHELVQEKPFVRRIGCGWPGCIGLPQPPESDVDGDLRADLVTLDNTGTSHTYRAIGAQGHATSLVGSMDPALYDGKGYFVIDVADVNGDWRADKVALSNGTVYVYPGKVDGTFGAGIGSFAGAMTPGPHDQAGFEPITVADVTGDAKGDLVVFKDGAGIKVYPGAANSTFGAPIVSLSGIHSALFSNNENYDSYFLDVVDVTGDRRADLVTTDNGITVYKGTASGEFTALGEISNTLWAIGDGVTGYEPIGLGDVNGDGRADLVSLAEGTVRVYEGKTTGKFQFSDSIGPTPSGTSFNGSMDSNLFDGIGVEIVGLLDENGDRKADLITLRSDGTVRIYAGEENFTFASTAKVRSLPEFTPGRFNRLPGHEVVSEKPFLFRAGCSPTGCHWPRVAVESDVDGDRVSDLVTLHTSGNAYVFPGEDNSIKASGTTSFAGAMDSALYDRTGHYVVDVSDVDGDTLADLVTLTDDGSVKVHRGQFDKTFAPAVSAASGLVPAMRPSGDFEPIAVGDVTGDGRGDLVGQRVSGGGTASGEILTFPGQGNGGFEDPVSSTGPSSIANSALKDGTGEYYLDVIDIDGDTLADLVGMSTGGSVDVFKGQASGKFAGTGLYTSSVNTILDDGVGQEPVGLGDVTGDSRADLVTLSSGSLKLYTAQANSTFAGPSNAHSSTFNSSMLDGTGDDLVGLFQLEGDRLADLVVVQTGGTEGIVAAYKAQPDGTFATWPFSSGAVPSNRFNKVPGHQFASEKPFLRRTGCRLGGCTPPKWSLKDPSKLASNLDDVSCVSYTSCIGVGSHTDMADVKRTLAMHWNGSSWSKLTTPEPSGVVSSELGGVSCTAANSCMAVGNYVNSSGTQQTLTMSWNGSAWSLVASPSPLISASQLSGISCTAANACSAVGNYVISSSTTQNTLAMRWNGTSWTIGNPTPPAGASSHNLSDVSCTASNCTAVGSYVDSAGVRKPMVYGSVFGVWSSSSTPPLPAGLSSAQLSDIACIATGPCNAVGSSSPAGLKRSYAITRPHGGSWSVVATPDPSGLDELVGISCPTASSCTAAGSSGSGAYEHPHALRWDGSAWSAQELEELGGSGETAPPGRLASVSCSAAVSCNAVGSQTFATTTQQLIFNYLLGEGWSAIQGIYTSNWMNGVSCVSESDCVAVGQSGGIGTSLSTAMAQRWDGSNWLSMPAIPNATTASVNAVSCSVANACTAVGNTNGGPALAVRWNGVAWSAQSPPSPAGATQPSLVDVTCTSSTHCLAVGSYRNASNELRSNAVTWNGSAWTVQSVPLPSGATAADLRSVSCNSASACRAVGSYTDVSGTYPLVVQWNGSGWSLNQVPIPSGATYTRLEGVSCSSTTVCVAVGTFSNGANSLQSTYVVRLSSGVWSIQTSPNSDTGTTGTAPGSSLWDVSCTSPTLCRVVGSSKFPSSGGTRGFVMESDGVSWGFQPTGIILGHPEAGNSPLGDIFCFSEVFCMVTGSSTGTRVPSQVISGVYRYE